MSVEPARPRTYRLVLRGELGDQFDVLFDGMLIARESGATVLRGSVKDQSHLAGIIERTQDLGMEIIALNEIVDDGER